MVFFHEIMEMGAGWIEVITGPMFSGKTEELIRRVRRAMLAGQTVIAFKPEIDVRYRKDAIVSHTAMDISAVLIRESADIMKQYRGERVVAIDEAQFMDEGIVRVANILACRGVRVIIAGLDMDYRGKPFGPMPLLMAVAEKVTKLTAVCMECGGDASFSYKIAGKGMLIEIGEKDKYMPLCRECFIKHYGAFYDK